MSQQYYYNSAQYTTPTSYAGQSVTPCYVAAASQPLTTGYTAATPGRPILGHTYVPGTSISSAHRSQAPVTYTYPTNAVIAPTLSVVSGQQATLLAPPHQVNKVGPPGTSFVIANGPTSAQTNLTNNGAYTVTTSYFQPIAGQTQVHQHSMAQAVAAAQQANFQAAMVAASTTRGRRPVFDARFQNFRKNAKTTPRSAIDSQVFYCEVCKISCAGPQTYKEHLDGQKHKKKASGSNVVVCASVKGSQRQLRCELCDVTCTGVDAYQAHIRGTKHLKTFKLHQRLGKPIPCADPLVLKTTPTTGGDINGSTVIIDTTDASTLKSVVDDSGSTDKIRTKDVSDTSKLEEHVDLNSLQEKCAPPVGAEYIETTLNECGKIIQYSCKLCSCKFNDPHAKDMHLKGRRHRLQYKKKVDPSLVVDIKSSTSRNWKVQEDRIRQKQQREEYWRRKDMQLRTGDMHMLEYSNMTSSNYRGVGFGVRPFETLDDKHLMAKHATIYPTEEEALTMQTMVQGCEKALRHISEILLDEVVIKEPPADEVAKDDAPKVVEAEKAVGEKLLSGAMRVGPLAKSLLLRGEQVVSLVLLCAKWPTVSLMNKVVEKLPEKLEELVPSETYEVSLNTEYQCILVSQKKEPEVHCYIHFTSSIVREESSDGAATAQPEDGLDRKRCLDALSSLRHTKWFQAKVANRQPCLTLIRILRDLCQRVPTWSPLSSWAVELLTEKVVSSEPARMSPGGALRRFFECVASGILLVGGPGLRDPCEKEMTDASSMLSGQDREDITASAQHALRLIAFRQAHKVLDMEPISAAEDKSEGNVRKRRHSGEETASLAVQKKDKKEAEQDDPSATSDKEK